MGSKTKIIVLHMKEIIYTAVFAALGILLIVLLLSCSVPAGRIRFRSAKGSSTLRVVYTSHLL